MEVHVRLRRCPRVFGTLLLATAGALVIVGQARPAAPVACGAVLTESLTLDQDLICAGTALKVAADGITVDLNGHSLRGTGSGIGIDVSGRSNVRIANGTIKNFADGIELSHADTSSIEGLTITANFNGVYTAFSHDLSIHDNMISGNDNVGIVLFFAATSARVIDNHVLRNGSDGIYLGSTNDAGYYRGNKVDDNGGFGFQSHQSTSTLVENTFSGNGLGGVRIVEDSVFDYVISGNVADRNIGTGIFVSPGIPDGGSNSAKLNTGEQCVNITCAFNKGLA
jgi:nitrous oxidase accessory protein NosD